jgi:hypothetical protein
MMWLILALILAFAVMQSMVIERLFREQRRTRRELDETYQQLDALAVAVDRQVLTQEQINDQIKPIAAAIRESNQMVVETMDSLVNTVRAAKAERQRLSELIEKTAASRATARSEPGPTAAQRTPEPAPPPPAPPVEQTSEQHAPIAWPDVADRLDITAVARKAGRSRSEIALAQRLGRTVGARKQAAG